MSEIPNRSVQLRLDLTEGSRKGLFGRRSLSGQQLAGGLRCKIGRRSADLRRGLSLGLGDLQLRLLGAAGDEIVELLRGFGLEALGLALGGLDDLGGVLLGLTFLAS
jgi:hypothetical protein